MSDEPEISIPEVLPTPDLRLDETVLRFGLNENGRDFVVGDIHGMFSHLRLLLDRLAFDGGRDRLFSVGDLVDRGPESGRALEWLAHPWFHACRGNHEQFAIDSEDPEQYDIWVNYNGGEWWLEVDESGQRDFRDAFAALPLALEVKTASGTVGIVHADVPPMLTWEGFAQRLEARDRDAALYAMWSRNRIQGTTSRMPVQGGVERVYCGHTPTRTTVRLQNVYYIDTGAVYISEGYEDARLTVVEIHPTRHTEHEIRTSEPLPAEND